MPWVSYPFLKLSKSDISENVERDLISYAGLGRRGWFRDDAARAQPLDFVQLECEFLEKSSQADPEVIEEWTRRRVRHAKTQRFRSRRWSNTCSAAKRRNSQHPGSRRASQKSASIEMVVA